MGKGSRAVDGEVVLPLSVAFIEFASQAAVAVSDPIHVFSTEGSDVEDCLFVVDRLNRKMKASVDPINVGV